MTTYRIRHENGTDAGCAFADAWQASETIALLNDEYPGCNEWSLHTIGAPAPQAMELPAKRYDWHDFKLAAAPIAIFIALSIFLRVGHQSAIAPIRKNDSMATEVIAHAWGKAVMPIRLSLVDVGKPPIPRGF